MERREEEREGGREGGRKADRVGEDGREGERHTCTPDNTVALLIIDKPPNGGKDGTTVC